MVEDPGAVLREGREVAEAPGASAAAALRGDGPRLRAARRLLPAGGRMGSLDRIATLAAQLLHADSAQVSLLDDAQHVAGGAGRAAGTVGTEGPLEESLCTVTATTDGPLVIEHALGDDRVGDLPPVVSGAVGSYLGASLVDDQGHVIGALCVFDPAPRQWSATDVSVLRQLASSVTTELELAALVGDHETSRLRGELAMDAAAIGAFDWDVVTGRLTWDDRLREIFGYGPSTSDATIDDFNTRVHPDDLPRVTTALQTAVDSGGEYAAEYRVCVPGLPTRWVSARGRALSDASGVTTRLMGAAYDATGERSGEARVTRVLEAMPAGFYSLDDEWRFTHLNADAERLLGRTREELLGTVIWDEFPATVASVFEASYRRAVESGDPVSFDAFYPEPLNGWYELRAWPSPDGLSVYFLEVTERRGAQQRAEQAAVRLALLARASAELSGALDAGAATAGLPELVVPALADWCIVSLVGSDGRLRDVGSWHVDEESRDLLRRYSRIRLDSLSADSPLTRARESATAITTRRVRLDALLLPGPALQLFQELDPHTVTAVPMRGRGRTLGLMSLFWSGDREPSEDDIATAQDVADRAGLALDNARLYQQQRQLAEELQRSLLTAPPEPDHAEIVVRYAPAAQAAQVGGDWYDAFLQRGGSTMLVIGDVAGHDTAAAAAMGQLRSLLRGIATYSNSGPAAVLTGLDQSMELLGLGTYATAGIARFEQDDDERARGVTRMRWSSAGHLPPLSIRPDGTVAVLAGWRSDLMLGVDPTAPRTETVLVLGRGETVFLYTDGLVERRDADLDEGLDRLRAALAEFAALPLPELCDAVLERLVNGRPEDDVALVAVRLHRQDGPRPVEAGPERVPDAVRGDADREESRNGGAAGRGQRAGLRDS